MVDIKKVLANLEKANMHVKRIGSGDLPHEYLSPIDTHYVMKDDKVVHIGNKETVICFALKLDV